MTHMQICNKLVYEVRGSFWNTYSFKKFLKIQFGHALRCLNARNIPTLHNSFNNSHKSSPDPVQKYTFPHLKK